MRNLEPLVCLLFVYVLLDMYKRLAVSLASGSACSHEKMNTISIAVMVLYALLFAVDAFVLLFVR